MYKIVCDKAQKCDEARGKIERSLLKCISHIGYIYEIKIIILWRLPLILQTSPQEWRNMNLIMENNH